MFIINNDFVHHFSPANTSPPMKIWRGKKLAGKITSTVNFKTNQERLREEPNKKIHIERNNLAIGGKIHCAKQLIVYTIKAKKCH